MIPDRLPESLREIIARFPPGALQFEVASDLPMRKSAA